MNGTPREVRVIDAAAVLCIAATLVLLLWPVRPQPRELALALPTAAPIPAAIAADSSAERIVATNIFSSSRRAPRTRFVPPGTEQANMSEMMPVGDSDAASGTGSESFSAPRLFGIIVQDGVRRALLQLPGSDSVPRLLAVGERQSGYRVVSIAADRVVLASASGSRTVRMVSRSSSDSLENMP